jgi:hypothetical protein
MRRIVLFTALVAVAGLGASTGTSGRRASFRATLTADTHSPRVLKTWHYHVRVTDSKGHPIWARVTSRIVDPLGTVHPVEFDGTGHNPYVKDYRFFGNFCDSAVWPRNSAVGVTLRFETVIVTAQGRRVLVYAVTPKS